MTLEVKSPISRTKAEYEGCATCAITRGVSSCHVLVQAFGDAYFRRENVRHATLLFCAEGGRTFVIEGVGEVERVMFLVSDGSRDNRKAIIDRIAAVDKAVGLILSEIDFEWTLRRAVLRLSKSPTSEIRLYLKDVHGLNQYKKAWGKYVLGEKHNQISDCLVSVVNGATVKGRRRLWDELKEAVDARHRLVHGINGFIKDKDAEHHIEVLFTATDAIADLCMRNGENVFERIKPRRNPSLTKPTNKHVRGK